MAIYELNRWLAYRWIEHPAMRVFVHTLPLALAAASTLIYLILPLRPSLSTEHGLLSNLLTLLAALPGFFIAALAAVATFDRPEMDEIMPEPSPKIEILRHGAWIEVPLTRRTFLTYLFAYLSILSGFASILCVVGIAIAPSFAALISDLPGNMCPRSATTTLAGIFVFMLSYVCASLLVTTLQGIYFLAERMHQPH